MKLNGAAQPNLEIKWFLPNHLALFIYYYYFFDAAPKIHLVLKSQGAYFPKNHSLIYSHHAFYEENVLPQITN